MQTGKQTVYGSDIPEKERYTSKDPNVRVTERKLVLTKHVLAIGAEFDQTGEIKAGSSPNLSPHNYPRPSFLISEGALKP
jgi:hypothetical protein